MQSSSIRWGGGAGLAFSPIRNPACPVCSLASMSWDRPMSVSSTSAVKLYLPALAHTACSNLIPDCWVNVCNLCWTGKGGGGGGRTKIWKCLNSYIRVTSAGLNLCSMTADHLLCRAKVSPLPSCTTFVRLIAPCRHHRWVSQWWKKNRIKLFLDMSSMHVNLVTAAVHIVTKHLRTKVLVLASWRGFFFFFFCFLFWKIWCLTLHHPPLMELGFCSALCRVLAV